jgi:hypothetical protein
VHNWGNHVLVGVTHIFDETSASFYLGGGGKLGI